MLSAALIATELPSVEVRVKVRNVYLRNWADPTMQFGDARWSLGCPGWIPGCCQRVTWWPGGTYLDSTLTNTVDIILLERSLPFLYYGASMT